MLFSRVLAPSIGTHKRSINQGVLMRNSFAAILATISLICTAPVYAADKAGGGIGADDMAKAMAKMQPGPEHQELAKQVGTWDVAATFWMDPAAAPQESKDTATF